MNEKHLLCHYHLGIMIQRSQTVCRKLQSSRTAVPCHFCVMSSVPQDLNYFADGSAESHQCTCYLKFRSTGTDRLNPSISASHWAKSGLSVLCGDTSEQSCKSGRTIRVGPGFGPGSGLSLSKCFGMISGLHTQVFYNTRSNDFFSFFLVLLTALTSVSEVIVIFFS